MFQLDPSPIFKTMVPLSRPGIERPIDTPFEFRHKTKEEFAAWRETLKGRADADVLHDVIVSWGVVDKSGQPVSYTHTALVKLLSTYTPAAREIFSKYESELTEAKAKN